MAARLSAFMVWAALAASAVFWGLRLTVGSPTAPAHTVPVGDGVVPHADLTRLFGAEPVQTAAAAPAPEQSRFKLIGLASPREAGGPGVAVIAVDGKLPRAYRIGASVDGDMVLQSVERRAVALGPRGGAATVRLELPVLAPAATGALLPPPAFGQENAATATPQGAAVPGVPMPKPGVPPMSGAMRPVPVPPTGGAAVQQAPQQTQQPQQMAPPQEQQQAPVPQENPTVPPAE